MANWDRITSRGTIDDRRGFAPMIGGGLGIVGLLAVVLFSAFTGSDPTVVLNQLNSVPIPQQTVDQSQFAGQDSYEAFASTVLGSTTDTWTKVFAQNNQQYTPPKFVLFRQATQSGCGYASSDSGPHTTVRLTKQFI